MRPRSQTIGTLGRTPARQSGRMAAAVPPPPPPPEPPAKPSDTLKRWMHAAFFDNMGLKFLSVVLAVTVFLLVNTDKDREITVRVGVRYDYPADKVLVSEQLDEVRVTIKGPWRVLRKFDERELKRIVLDLKGAPSGEIAITPDMITNLPARLTVTSISPRTVRVAFDKRIEKLVEVDVVTSTPEYGYQVIERKATERCSTPPCAPAGTVRVRGGERLLAALSSVRTTEVQVEGHEVFDGQAELVLPPGVDADAPKVNVHIAFDEARVVRKYPGRPVAIKGDGIDPARWTLEPAQVDVTLQGSLLSVEKAKDLPVIVRVAPADIGRTREADVMIENLPSIVGKQFSPERVKLVPVKAPPAPPPPPPQP
jgi:YbbR domain-containing protein